MLRKFFQNTVYVKVKINGFDLRHIEYARSYSLSSHIPFTTERLLVGNFSHAEDTLKKGLKKVHEGQLLAVAPTILVHPLEMIEGGLSEVEERILRELAAAAGARKSAIWLGHILTDREVIEKLK